MDEIFLTIIGGGVLAGITGLYLWTKGAKANETKPPENMASTNNQPNHEETKKNEATLNSTAVQGQGLKSEAIEPEIQSKLSTSQFSTPNPKQLSSSSSDNSEKSALNLVEISNNTETQGIPEEFLKKIEELKLQANNQQASSAFETHSESSTGPDGSTRTIVTHRIISSGDNTGEDGGAFTQMESMLRQTSTEKTVVRLKQRITTTSTTTQNGNEEPTQTVVTEIELPEGVTEIHGEVPPPSLASIMNYVSPLKDLKMGEQHGVKDTDNSSKPTVEYPDSE